MVKYILSWIFLFVLIYSHGQRGIDYSHKKIYKEIEKFWGIEQPHFQELLIPDLIKQGNYIQGKYFSVTNKNNVNQTNFMYIGRVNSCRAGGCSISLDPNLNYETEYFDYFILFDSASAVQLVRIYNYMATHGHEVSAKGWLRQFDGYDGTNTLEVGKNIDAISGATISVYAITKDVKEKTAILKKMPSRF